MNILAITQARYGSSRFPGKILKEINGETLLAIHLRRILLSKRISKLKVATTIEQEATRIVSEAGKFGVETYLGSVDNVLERFYQTAKEENPEFVVRLTSDCPLIDSNVIDSVIEFAIQNDLDYASNTLKPTYPDGLDIEVFKYSALQVAHRKAKLKSELEHVTPYIWKNSSFVGGNIFKSDCFMNKTDLSELRMTVDTPEDFAVIEKLIHLLGTDKDYMEYVSALLNNRDIKAINEQIKRNEGYDKSIKGESN